MLEYATITIASLSAAAAIASAAIAYRVLQRQAVSDLPAIEISIKSEKGVAAVKVTMTNRSLVGWGAEEARVLLPIGARVINEADAPHNEDRYGGRHVDLASVDRAASRASTPMQLSVGPAGSKSSHGGYGYGDRHSETLFVFLPRWVPFRRLSMRVRVASSEAAQRRSVIAINRTLPASMSRITE